MSIRVAQKSDFDIVKSITHITINKIYPHYYANGAVAFFLQHHNDENIKRDYYKPKCFSVLRFRTACSGHCYH